MKKVILIDGNSLMHRAYHGVKFAPVFEGKPVGMVYGFTSLLINIIFEYHPDYLVVAFDTKEKTFRHEMDSDYKAHRGKTDDDFYAQIPLVLRCLENFSIPVLTMPGYEADDIIGTLAKSSQASGFEVEIMSSDLDFLQLLSLGQVSLVAVNGNIQKSLKYTPKEALAKLGVPPEQVVDFKAIVGDSSDNYKGVPGVGPKTAVRLLKSYVSLEGVYQHLDDLPVKLREKFEAHKAYAFHCYDLARIRTDVPIENKMEIFDPSDERVLAFLRELRFFALVGRYEKLNNAIVLSENKEQENCSEIVLKSTQMSLF